MNKRFEKISNEPSYKYIGGRDKNFLKTYYAFQK